MADVKHTPGPWEVNYTRFSQVTASNGALVATCEKLDGLTTLQANARLIAAAPDLLEALKRIADGQVMGDSKYNHADVILAYQRIASGAIAKATGAARATEGSAT